MDSDQLQKYKTLECENEKCKSLIQSASTSLMLDCSFYHIDRDRRRLPILNNKLQYHPYYLYDCSDANSPFCNNLVEYLFHPMVYLTQQCPSQQTCTAQYCPHYHSEENRLKTEKSKFFFSEFEELLQNMLGEPDASNSIGTLSLSRLTSEASLPQQQVKLMKFQPRKRKLKLDGKFQIDNEFPLEMSFSVVSSMKETTHYKMNDLVKFFEDQTHEFKMLKQIKIEMVAKYICAFLNARGGTLYIGITDEGRVRGLPQTREEIDQFQLQLDAILRRFEPCVLQEQVFLSFVPVYHDKMMCRGIRGQQYFVIEIKVHAVNKYELYFTHKREAYVKKTASVIMLEPKEIKYCILFSQRAYVRQRTINQMQAKIP